MSPSYRSSDDSRGFAFPAHRIALPGLRVLLALLACAPLSAVTIAVPADAPTIQAAILLAQPGDEVLVAPGTWPENIDFLGKAITVRSSAGPAVTTIDGMYLGSVVTFQSGEGPGSILEGFTICRGFVYEELEGDLGGGGILIDGASPVIRENVIADNATTGPGAGIFCQDSNALIQGNLFTSNESVPNLNEGMPGYGGGIAVKGGAVILEGNRFVSNRCGWHGGAIYLSNTQGSVVRDTVCFGNTAWNGGAIAVDASSTVEIENLLAIGNVAWGHGSIFGIAEGSGGGIYIGYLAVAQIRSATIVGNTANSGDTAPGSGGGVYWEPNPGAPLSTVTNSIIRGNSAATDPQVDSATLITFSNVQGGAPGAGNFDADPLFVAGPAGAHYLSQVAAGQGADSPCVDAGDPLAFPIAGSTTRTDLAPDTGTIDIGYHYPPLGAIFRRGDCNVDAASDIADAVYLLGKLFPSPSGPDLPYLGCADACDANDDGVLDIADPIALLMTLFGGGPTPPPTGACGPDPTPNSLGCALPPPC